MNPIDFSAKTDRELLILTAQSVNDINDKLAELNGTVKEHAKRITQLEDVEQCKESIIPTRLKLAYMGLGVTLAGIVFVIVGKALVCW